MKRWHDFTTADKLTRARSLLVTTQPFFGCLALHLDMSERPDLTDTMATDGRHLFYAAPFVDSLTEAELIGLWAHEVHHLAYGHHARMQNRELGLFNEAADYAINRDLKAAAFVLPSGLLLNPEFDGMGAEEIYSVLASARPQQPQPQPDGKPDASGDDAGEDSASEGQPGDDGQQDDGGDDAGQPGQDGAPGASQGDGGDGEGEGQPGAAGAAGGPASGQPDQSGQDGAPASGGGAAGQDDGAAESAARKRAAHGMGGIIAPANEADAEAEIDRWQVLARQALAVAKAANAGTLPGYLRDLKTALDDPRADFRDLLAAFIDSRIVSDYSFQRPNRRYLHAGVVLPGAVVDGLEHVVFAVDTSGSMTADMIAAAGSEIAGAMEAGKIARLTVAMADTRVVSWQEFSRGDDVDFRPAGGGGTDFRDTFRTIADRAPDASAVVYLTDLEVNEFGDDPGCPVLWAVHGDSRKFEALAARVPFGEAVYIGRL